MEDAGKGLWDDGYGGCGMRLRGGCRCRCRCGARSDVVLSCMEDAGTRRNQREDRARMGASCTRGIGIKLHEGDSTGEDGEVGIMSEGVGV